MQPGKYLAILALALSGCIFGGGGGTPLDPDMGSPSDTGDSLDASRDANGGTDAAADASSSPDAGADSGSVPENCGDGTFQAGEGEKCDPAIENTDSAAYCPRLPEDCEDGEACTLGFIQGSPAECTAVCAQMPIETCVNGDGCCPADCTPEDDDDCLTTNVCGDGVVTGMETCDVGITTGDGACPTRDTCPMPAACERVVIEGENCGAACSYIEITTCVSDDGCCPAGCTVDRDDDCSATCGNGVIETGEVCDGNCPTACDDGDACTDDTLSGSAGMCDAVCANAPITACVSDDGCCPSGCTNADDNDCSASCGDGVIDVGETCDPPSSCPGSCDDSDPSTRDVLTGSAANCNVTCTNTPITTCSGTSSDGYCPSGCNATTDDDCIPLCGNGFVEPGEQCDGNCPSSCDDGDACTSDAVNGSAAACNAVCSNTDITTCVDDDGCCAPGCNAVNDNDCNPVCGNAIVEPGEACDGNCPTSCNDGNSCTTDVRTGSAGSCNVGCSNTPISSCVDGDGCCPSGCSANNDSDCSSSCGNGVVEPGETCDGTCPTSCGPCQALSGSASSCNVQCVTNTSCQTCTLGGSCSCGGTDVCVDGECAPDSGSCNDACDPDGYCENLIGTGYSCNNNTGNCVQCFQDGDCQGFQYCNGGTCQTAPDCSAASVPANFCDTQENLPFCNEAEGECYECNSNADCTGAEVCLPTSFCGVPPCSSNDDCADVEYCNNNNQCQKAPTCNLANDGDAWCDDSSTGTICLGDSCWVPCAGFGPCDCPNPQSETCQHYENNTSNPLVCARESNFCFAVCEQYQDQWCVDNEPGTTQCSQAGGCL